MKKLSKIYVSAILVLFLSDRALGSYGDKQVARIGLGIITILYLPVFISLISIFRKQTSKYWLLLVLYVSFGGLAINLFLALTGIRPLVENMSIQRLLVGSYYYILIASVFVSVFTLWRNEDFLWFFKILYWIINIISIESLIFFYLLRGQVMPRVFIGYDVRFISAIIGSDSIVARLAIIQCAISLLFYYQQKSRSYLWGILFSFFLVFSTLSRPAVISWTIFIFLSVIVARYLGKKKTLMNIFFQPRFLLTGIIIIVFTLFIFSVASGVREDFSKENTLYARLLIWSHAIEVIDYGFPLGVGANQSDFYMSSFSFPTSYLTEYLLSRLSWFNEIKAYEKSIVGIRNSQQTLSSHSFALDIVIDFGLIGIILVWLIYKTPISIIKQNIQLKFDETRLLVMVIACFLVSFFISVLFDSSSDRLLWIIAIFFSFMIKLNKSLKTYE